ncbi:hypothetical protein [Vibrio sp. TBV020]|uniref:hypothetical protein n=1 Tax=Vibrio sp. TBV020 TaxID=3137398 RepID=UPI0038CD5A5E
MRMLFINPYGMLFTIIGLAILAFAIWFVLGGITSGMVATLSASTLATISLGAALIVSIGLFIFMGVWALLIILPAGGWLLALSKP